MGNRQNLPEVEPGEIDWANLEASLDEAKRWLDAPQPEGAINSHHGSWNHVGCGTLISAIPGGMIDHNQDDEAVIGFQRNQGDYISIPDPDRREGSGLLKSVAYVHYPAFTDDERTRIDEAVRARFEVLDDWNTPYGSNSSPSYSASYLVRADPNGAVKATSSYYRRRGEGRPDTNQLGIEPNWVSTPSPSPPATTAPEPVRNAETVANTIANTTPLLEQLGVHPGTIQAGALGDIEGDPGKREFVARDALALGVALPAETFEEIVRLATIGAEFDGEV